ncbi:MAG: restriction endonuclease subunit S [candidate division WOR-3 bacterium]|nr:restriction endonuclease subunit S [candidate division WOR-3 bacterium]
MKRLKHVARLAYGDSLPDAAREGSEVPVFGSNGEVGRHTVANTLAPALVIGRKGSYGKINYSDVPCFAIDTTYFVDRRTSSVDVRWLSYALPLLRLDEFSEDSAVPGLSRDFVYSHWLPAVDAAEQRAIAAFLDRETQRIDALVEKKERLVELLREQRTALISHAVTKGLEPNVRLKDSGVEWLGRIPEHWEVLRVRDIAHSLQTGPFGSQLHSDEYTPEGTPVVNPANIQRGRICPDSACAVDVETARRLARHELQQGDVLFARRGELGRCALVTKAEEGWLCGTGSLRVRLNQRRADPQFCAILLSTKGVADWLSLESVGATMDNLNTGILGRIPLALPQPEEQRSIAAFLTREAQRIDVMVEKVRRSVELLKEYRTALISAAVTGKIDVRDVA